MAEVFSLMVREMAMHADIPPVEFFKEWSLRFQGISYFINEMKSPHASIAWSNLTSNVGVASERYGFIEAERAATMRRILWECACEAEEGVRNG